MRRHYLGAAVVLLAEAYLYWHYAQLHAGFHYWLHGLLGAALGLDGLTGARLVTALRRPTLGQPPVRGCLLTAWEAAALGHLYAAFPDILFLTLGLPHGYWMRVRCTSPCTSSPRRYPRRWRCSCSPWPLRPGDVPAAARRRHPPTVAALTIIVAVPFAAAVPTNIQDLRSHP